jgi:predicted O-methyltransferase YrrM
MSLLLHDAEGWLTEAQAHRLAAAADRVGPEGLIVEIGSFHGRSTVVLARAAPEARVVAVDPHLGSEYVVRDTGVDVRRGDADNAAFRANLARAGVADRVRHVRHGSEDPAALAAVDGPIDLLYVDGVHRASHALSDIRAWGGRVRPGGTMLVHDAFSSGGVTVALLRGVTPSREWTYRGREGSLAEYVRSPPEAPARNVLRQAAALPWFARNMAIKALLLARLTPVTRLLGHRPGDPAPY